MCFMVGEPNHFEFITVYYIVEVLITIILVHSFGIYTFGPCK